MANGLPRPTIPVGCIVVIAFFTMQIGVYSRPLGPFVLLSRFVGLFPIALPIPPQASEGECESGWRLRRGELLTKIVQDHLSLCDEMGGC
jgi:hypothetical protein